MFELFPCIISLLSITLIFFVFKRHAKVNVRCKYNYPIGPRGLPVFGHLLQMVKAPHKKLSQWSSTYGKMYTINLAGRQAVVLTDAKLIKDILSLPVATGKFKTDSMLLVSQGNYGILNAEGKLWSEQKLFCMKTLIDFGFGSKRLVNVILEDINRVDEWIQNSISNNQNIILDDVLKAAMNGALWRIITGERLEFDDHRISTLLDEFLRAMNYTVQTGLGFFPWLKYISPELSGYAGFDRICKELHKFMETQVKLHRRKFVEGSPSDFIDAYIEKMDNCKDPDSAFYSELGEMNTVSTLVELFTGGGDTTSATLIWQLFYLSWNLDMQNKLYEEIQSVVGEHRDPSLQDKARMPYTEAVILETFRCTSLLPLGVMHELLEDLTVTGHKMKKGTILIANLYGCHNSKDVWGDSEIFRPERFIEDSQMKQLVIPFQPGKRSCPGEPLAKDVMFLFTVKLLGRWEVSPTEGITKSSYFKVDDGVMLLPRRLPVAFKRR